MQENNKEDKFQSKSIISNIIWKFLERGSSVAVTLLVNVLLARLLDPSIHGLLAMVSVFVTISEIFVTAGLGSALIQKKNADTLDFSTIFWLNLMVSAALYILLFVASPWISDYFGYSELNLILRVLSLKVIISGVNSVQCAYISRNMMFRHYFFSTLSGKILSGIIGVGLAFCGAGVWALVAQSLSITLVETIVLWFRVKWRPTLQFSWNRGKSLYAFAYKIMFTSFVETITDQLRSLIIGKRYSSVDLAYYNKGALFPNSLTTNVTSALSAVMYPVLVNRQDDLEQVRAGCRRWISVFAYSMFPILTGFAATAKTLIPVLLTEKWTASVPYLQIACGIYAAWVIEVPIREAIKSIGKAGVCLRIQIIKTALSLVSLLAVQRFGVMAIAITTLGCAFVKVLISTIFGWRYLGYSPKMLMQDILPPLLLCITMAICVSLLTLIIYNRFVCLCVQVIVGAGVYWLGSILTENSTYRYLISLVRKNS